MIDDKKIAEAAMAHCVFNQANHNEHFFEGFKAGAYWTIQEFLKDLWHDASEEPDIVFERQLICVLQDDNKEKILPVFVTKTMDWEHFARINNITRWLYINDLLPKKGEYKKNSDYGK